jgi:hypothetical protein
VAPFHPLTRSGPVKPNREAAFLRLMVQTRTQLTAAGELALRAAVRDTLGHDASGRDWRVGRLFGPADDDREGLSQFYEITGFVDAYSIARDAWDLGYVLTRVLGPLGAVRVEPDLPSSCYHPVISEEMELFGLVDEHLPGSDRRDWALDAIHCPQAWELVPPEADGRQKGEGISVGHPDTGYADHAELEREALDLAKDADVIVQDDDARDPLEHGWLLNPGHGTRTASVIVGRPEGSVVGVAPLATLVPIRTVKSVVQVFSGDLAKAVDHARRSGCHVISMSLGGIGFVGLEAAIGRAVRDGVIVMAAAGNYVGFVVWPARYHSCIAVAATNVEDRPWRHSSHGPDVDVSAPGESVWVPDLEGDDQALLSRGSGTSYAVTHLAGVAALWLAFHGRDQLVARYGAPHLQDVFVHLLKTTGHRRPDGWQITEFGVGILDAETLLKAPLPSLDDVLTTTAPAATGLQPEAPDPFETIHAVMPELSREQVVERLQELLQAEGRELEEKLDHYAKELQYELVENWEFRATFLQEPHIRVLVQPTATPLRTKVTTGRWASRTLITQLMATQPRRRRNDLEEAT